MSVISHHTDNNTAMADTIVEAGMRADTALSADSASDMTDSGEVAAGDSDSAALDAQKDTDDPAELAGQPQPVTIPTFADLLKNIALCQGNYRKMHTTLLVALYLAWVTFRDAPKADREVNQKVLDDQCAAQGITATKNRLKLAQLAFGKNAQRASAKARVIKILEGLGIKPDECGKWLEDNGGFEAVRIGYNTDGSKNDGSPKPKSPRASHATAGDDDNAQYITKAKAVLATSVKATIPAGQLDQIANDAECTAILRQQADGSFVVIAVLNDAKVVEAAYAAHGRTLQ